MKPLDLVIICVLFAASFSTLFIFTSHVQGAEAELRVDGKVIRDFDLTQNQTWTYRDADGDYNEIEVKNGAIAVVKANCKDQIDVHRGYINEVGQTIVCLPHKLVIEVISGKTNDQVDYTA